MELSLLHSVILFLSASAGGFINTVCGFGLGALAMSVWPYVIPYSQSVALTGMCGVTMMIFIAVSNFRFISFKKLLPCLISGFIASGAAVHFSVGAAEEIMVRSLGLILIALGIYQIFFSGRISINASPRNGTVAGLISGTLSGLFAVGGPPIAIYLLAACDSPKEYRATLNAHFSMTTFFATYVRWRHGIITSGTVDLWIMLLAALGTGLFIGNKVFDRLDTATLRKLVYGYLVISGILLLVR